MSYYPEQVNSPPMAVYNPNIAPPPPQQFYPPPAQPFVAMPDPAIRKVRDWLAWSIINIILGWFILGIIALIFSILCRSRKRSNDYQEARSMSTAALVCNILATIVGVLSWIGFIIWLVFYVRLVKEISSS